MGLALNSLAEHVDFSQEKEALLDALNDGLAVYQHFSHLFTTGDVRLYKNYDSPFPTDKKYRKGFRLHRPQHNGRVHFHCNATSREGNCFTFAMELMGWNFKQTKEYFQQTILGGLPLVLSPNAQLVVRVPRLVVERETVITCWQREWEPQDDERYGRVGIDLATRQRYHCYPLRAAHVVTEEHEFTVYHSQASPLYGYWFELTNRWKINHPLQPKGQGQKWYASTKGHEDLFAQHLIPPAEKPLPLGLLGPGQRDSMALSALLNVPVHALNSESAHLTPDQYALLRARYQRLAFFTDPDKAGEQGARHLAGTWGLPTLNHVLHPILGELDLCGWLGTPLGLRPRARARLAELLNDTLFELAPTF
jgi:hypothetical protein